MPPSPVRSTSPVSPASACSARSRAARGRVAADPERRRAGRAGRGGGPARGARGAAAPEGGGATSPVSSRSWRARTASPGAVPKLVAQQHAQALVGGERLGDVAAGGQRLHQQPMAGLAERRLAHRCAAACSAASAAPRRARAPPARATRAHAAADRRAPRGVPRSTARRDRGGIRRPAIATAVEAASRAAAQSPPRDRGTRPLCGRPRLLDVDLGVRRATPASARGARSAPRARAPGAPATAARSAPRRDPPAGAPATAPRSARRGTRAARGSARAAASSSGP